MFKAIWLARDQNGFSASVRELEMAELRAGTPDADVTVAIEHSTINYKDGLALTDRSPVVRRWPMIAGIDAAGTVVESASPRWAVGQKVVLTGWGAGESEWGGLAQRARFKADWLVALPEAFSTRQAMAIGTAGFTAALCVLGLEHQGLSASAGDVLVTGASGGVGSIAIALLGARGYSVTASTGKAAEGRYLQALGASRVVDRAELASPGKPLQKERWAAVIDSVGSHTLANACAQTRADGWVAACGLAQGMDFPATVAPFILRGVSLLGINSVTTPPPRRQSAWALLANSLDGARLDSVTRMIPLGDSFAVARDIVDGKVRGRVVVDVNACP
jgi:acrylyl-CoA reductase (NADPH)